MTAINVSNFKSWVTIEKVDKFVEYIKMLSNRPIDKDLIFRSS